ncbi:MAG: penicillin-binding protein 1C [Spirochaetales bacterium]|nr:penicillin-binding protein 1C [Spirochaetales bacterium]
MNIMKNLLFYIILVMIITQITFLLFPFPELDKFKSKSYSPCLFDRKGTLLHVIPLPDGQRREYARLDEIHPDIISVFIQSEDKRFFYHHGIDFIAVIRSLSLNIKSGYIVSGASSISMQLARMILPHKRGITGKLWEAINAIRLEAQCSKEEIIELWLNSIPVGMNTTGIASASRVYFHKDVKMLTKLEACILAVIIRNPSLYNPFSEQELLIDAVKKLAIRMGTGSGTERESRLEKEIRSIISNLTPFEWPFLAPHFSLYVKNNLSPDELTPGRKISGREIATSLDLALNHLVEEKIRHALDKHQHNRLTNGAALVLNNRTREILAYTGSNDFNDKEHAGEIDGLHIHNQPGSCLKPFLYAYALENGFSPNTLLPDIPTDFGTDEVYRPVNFNNRFHGPVRLRVALASSLNVPAVYMITRLGVENFRQKLVELGFHSLDNKEHQFGSGLALGNAEITLFELTQAFSIFPAKGIKAPPVWKYRKKARIPDGKRVFSPYTSAMICHMLSDNASRALGFTTDSVLNTGIPVMFKTGTSNQFGNIWALGATVNYTVGVWLGNFSGKTVIGMPGSSIPAQIVKEIISIIDRSPEPFPVPEEAKKVRICSLSGGLATDACPGIVEEYLPYHASIKPCDFHYRENGMLKTKYPPLYTSWAREQLGNDMISLPYEYETPFIRQPGDGEYFYTDPSIPVSQQAVKFEIIHTQMNDILSVFVNGIKADDITYPYTWFFPLKKGKWCITVKDHDSSDIVRIMVK